jgi:hypothetical protein
MEPRPFALSLIGDPQHCLERLIRWFRADARFVIDLEANVEPLALDIGMVASTSQLSSLLVAQIIELDLVGRDGGRDAWRVLVRDGASVDLLGYGDHSSLTSSDIRVESQDPVKFLWAIL